jgi:predicted Zn-dependent peptidase
MPDMQHTIHTLQNGLRVVLIPMEGSKTATVIVMTGTGSRYEDERENGLAHFLEHMFFKGTKKRKDARAISEELDGVGSVYNAFTSKERTAYWAKVSAEYIDTALDVVSDIFLNSKLPPAEITKERGAVLQEIDMYEDMPMRTVDNVFDALIFGEKHPLGRTILGPKENIKSFSRKEFSNYMKRNYTSHNTVVVVAGNFSEHKVLWKIHKEFSDFSHETPPTYIPFASTQHEPRVAIKQKKTDQTQFMLGVPAYPYMHHDEFALEVLSSILGGGMSSRLFIEVREKRGLAYSVRSWADRYPDTGYFVVQAGVEHAKLEKSVKTILDEFKKMKKAKVSNAELEKAKAHIKGSLALQRETSDEVAEFAATSIINLNRVRTFEEIVEGIDKVTALDVQRVAQDILLTEKLNLAIIGPHSSEKDLVKLLKV